MITLTEFNTYPYFATVAYIDDILSISPDQFRDDFSLFLDVDNNIKIEQWFVIGVSQPTIAQICEALTMERVNLCISALS